eukprot:COSAG03_NODE_17120_length_383_cov_3.091549_2_plen_20_part_01
MMSDYGVVQEALRHSATSAC